MPVRLATFALVTVAAAALAATWAPAAATRRFVKGEHVRYSNALSLALGEGPHSARRARGAVSSRADS